MNHQTRHGFLRQAGAATGAALIGVSLAQLLSACKDADSARCAGEPFRILEPGSPLDHLQAASINYPIAIGRHAGRKALMLYGVALEKTTDIPLLAVFCPYKPRFVGDLNERFLGYCGP